jgi:hypothetical protein
MIIVVAPRVYACRWRPPAGVVVTIGALRLAPHAGGHTSRRRTCVPGQPSHDSDHDAVAATAIRRDVSKTSSNGGRAPSSHRTKVSARGPQHNKITILSFPPSRPSSRLANPA